VKQDFVFDEMQTARKVGKMLHRDMMAVLKEEEKEEKFHERSGFLR